MLGGSEEQMPPHAATIAFGFPELSYVPITKTGSGYAIVCLPNDCFMSLALLLC